METVVVAGGLRDLLADASRRLAAVEIDTAALDAEVMMAAAAGISRVEVIGSQTHPSAKALERFDAMVTRRERREPIAYIIGHREFYSLDIHVTPAVLIPRPETEAVVDAALAVIAGAPPRVATLDIGTGSGCIALAIAANDSASRIVATDLSSEALKVAALNAKRLGLAARIDLRLSDLFDCLADDNFDLPRERFDLIVSNPPYVRDGEALPPEVGAYEPAIALYGGLDGLAIYRRIAAAAREHLNPNGTIIVEVGAEQAESVGALFRAAGAMKIETAKDLAGIDRVVIARFPGSK
jgi:release factor glutamine methyltransferase